jgi:hypothetical protein
MKSWAKSKSKRQRVFWMCWVHYVMWPLKNVIGMPWVHYRLWLKTLAGTLCIKIVPTNWAKNLERAFTKVEAISIVVESQKFCDIYTSYFRVNHSFTISYSSDECNRNSKLERGAALAQVVACWASDLQVERSILCLGCVSFTNSPHSPRLLPSPL